MLVRKRNLMVGLTPLFVLLLLVVSAARGAEAQEPGTPGGGEVEEEYVRLPDTSPPSITISFGTVANPKADSGSKYYDPDWMENGEGERTRLTFSQVETIITETGTIAVYEARLDYWYEGVKVTVHAVARESLGYYYDSGLDKPTVSMRAAGSSYEMQEKDESVGDDYYGSFYGAFRLDEASKSAAKSHAVGVRVKDLAGNVGTSAQLRQYRVVLEQKIVATTTTTTTGGGGEEVDYDYENDPRGNNDRWKKGLRSGLITTGERYFYVSTMYEGGSHGSLKLEGKERDGKTDKQDTDQKEAKTAYGYGYGPIVQDMGLRMFYFWKDDGKFVGWMYGKDTTLRAGTLSEDNLKAVKGNAPSVHFGGKYND